MVESGRLMYHAIPMVVLETFEIERGLIVAVQAPTDLPVGKRLSAVITRGDGTTISATAYKEWLLRRDPELVEGEAFLLRGLRKTDVPVGSEVTLLLAAPPLGKAHSATIASEFRALGWALATEFRAEGHDEPYEYLFEWHGDGEPRYPSAR
ncbi:MAG: hypothetical protein JWM65_2617 [Sphingomonas bacterium]|nr:hypothetical protein [Sphingomonas bacterium]